MDKLNNNGGHDVLVYIPRQGMEVMPEQNLREHLHKHPELGLTTKEIPRGNLTIEILHEDLFDEAHRAEYKDLPNMKASLAGATLPKKVIVERLLLNRFKELYIVSPQSANVEVKVKEDI